MSTIPENVTLEFIGRTLIEFREEMRNDVRALRTDVDMLTRMVIRIDNSVDALRHDLRDLWLSQGDLRRRIEALEESRRT